MTTKYKLIQDNDGVMDLETGAYIPKDPFNRDWQEYQLWLAHGNGPLEPDINIPDEPVKKAQRRK